MSTLSDLAMLNLSVFVVIRQVGFFVVVVVVVIVLLCVGL